MSAESARRPNSPFLSPIVVIGLLGVVLAIRLAHLSSAMGSPLTYQPGPDEDYYQRFGQAVAAGQGQDSPEFTFMDPAYGYLLGAIFKLAGVNVFVVYLLQALLDTATAYGILAIGDLLGRPRAGLYGAVLYGLSATGIMFSATLLKEVWVTSYLTWWVVGALLLIRSDRTWAWLAFGIYCGLGVAFRSTLIVMCAIALALPVFSARQRTPRAGIRFGAVALLACGMLVALLPSSLRNYGAYSSLSPLPHNGGIVLHQIYNPQNPAAEIWIPEFVNYLHPSEIWRGYAAEASRRAGRPLSPTEVDHYWRSQALAFIWQHPTQVLADMLRKTRNWLSDTEVANNRSYVEERMFSPVLRLLPAPAAWLLAMGLAGLLWLAVQDRRWPIVAAPVALSLFTAALFFSESRFRFHATGLLALCSGIWIDQLAAEMTAVRKWQVAFFAALAAVIGIASVCLGRQEPPAPIRWDRIVWGYINMGNLAQAEAIAARVVGEQPDNGAIFEALGYTAAARREYDEAVRDLKRAIELRPRSHVAHYNLAGVLLAQGNLTEAAAEADIAVRLHPSSDYRALQSRIATAK